MTQQAAQLPTASGRRRPGGYTLIEIMIVTAIIGLLSSVAIPGYSRLILRARTAERTVILTAVSRSAQDVLAQKGQFPTPFNGAANPPGTPTAYKRIPLLGQPGWKDIDLFMEGGVYYSYSFVGTNAPILLSIHADGDLDGDGLISSKTLVYSVANGALMPVPGLESPPQGLEDALTF